MTAIVVAAVVLLGAAILLAGRHMPTSGWGVVYLFQNAAHEFRYQVARLLLYAVRVLYRSHPGEYSALMTSQCTRYTSDKARHVVLR